MEWRIPHREIERKQKCDLKNDTIYRFECSSSSFFFFVCVSVDEGVLSPDSRLLSEFYSSFFDNHTYANTHSERHRNRNFHTSQSKISGFSKYRKCFFLFLLLLLLLLSSYRKCNAQHFIYRL